MQNAQIQVNYTQHRSVFFVQFAQAINYIKMYCIVPRLLKQINNNISAGK